MEGDALTDEVDGGAVMVVESGILDSVGSYTRRKVNMIAYRTICLAEF